VDEHADIGAGSISVEDVVVTVTHSGYLKRTPVSDYRQQQRGGKGRIGMRTREEDFVEYLFVASTHSYLLIFTNQGKVHWLKVYEIPDVGTAGKGKAIVNLVNLGPEEKMTCFGDRLPDRLCVCNAAWCRKEDAARRFQQSHGARHHCDLSG
jgi:DNA gyrase subunit A